MDNNRVAVTYLYINGLGTGKGTVFDRIIDAWWRLNGKRIVRFPVNWFAKNSIDELLRALVLVIDRLFEQSDRVAIIGSSAGGSLAINAFAAMESKNLFVITSRSRLKSGTYPPGHRMSMDSIRKLSDTFYQSVLLAERSISNLSDTQKERILILMPLTDNVVPRNTMGIRGATTHISFAFDHHGGYLAHMVGNIWRIDRFVRKTRT